MDNAVDYALKLTGMPSKRALEAWLLTQPRFRWDSKPSTYDGAQASVQIYGHQLLIKKRLRKLFFFRFEPETLTQLGQNRFKAKAEKGE